MAFTRTLSMTALPSRRLSRRAFGRFAFTAAGLAAVAATAGCPVLGILADKAGPAPVKAAYPGLAGQSVAIMVVTDKGTQQEHRRIQLDVAERLDASLQIMTKADNVDEVKGTKYPKTSTPAAVFQFQRNYPEYEWEPVTKVAPWLKASRVIHIEISGFTLHADNVPELFKGEMSARVQVAEVTGDTAKVAFEDRVSAVFPDPSRSQVGTLDLGPDATYRGTINAFVVEVVKRFVKHPGE
jgi:hypothetical protein